MGTHLRKTLALLLCLIAPPVAANDAPLFYARTQIVIVPSQAKPPAPPPSLPWLESSAAHKPLPAPPQPQGISFDTEQRDARTVHTAGWINLSAMQEHQALMLVFPAPVTAAIRSVRDYSPYDVLTVSEEGRILQILPKLVLADLAQPYQTPSPVKAILYLRGGTCETEGIVPGDRVVNKLFKTRPTVLEGASQ